MPCAWRRLPKMAGVASVCKRTRVFDAALPKVLRSLSCIFWRAPGAAGIDGTMEASSWMEKDDDSVGLQDFKWRLKFVV